LAALALDPASTAEDRVALLSRAQDPLGGMPKEALAAFVRILGSRAAGSQAALKRELGEAKKLEGPARDRLVQLVEEGASDLLPVALAGLGHIGRPQDARRVAAGLEHPAAAVREAAAAGLARMGKAGEGGILWALGSSSAPLRALGALAAAQSYDLEMFRLLGRGLEDPDASVRQTAMAALVAAQPHLHPARKEFAPRLERLAAQDPSPEARATAAFLAGSLR
ncbi:MAG: hypothetical protein HY554_08795, partial [Elusimicrobia bacterium]|nr:hypothetical protein [Elusimicrobiota bacterium]